VDANDKYIYFLKLIAVYLIKVAKENRACEGEGIENLITELSL